jgi:hypothetical protein
MMRSTWRSCPAPSSCRYARSAWRPRGATTRSSAWGRWCAETPHFDFVAGEAARGIAEVARRHDLPIGFGVLTTDTIEQALARTGGDRGNKGYEAAVTALEMVRVLRVVQRY